jgi:hypothetical protein
LSATAGCCRHLSLLPPWVLLQLLRARVLLPLLRLLLWMLRLLLLLLLLLPLLC